MGIPPLCRGQATMSLPGTASVPDRDPNVAFRARVCILARAPKSRRSVDEAAERNRHRLAHGWSVDT